MSALLDRFGENARWLVAAFAQTVHRSTFFFFFFFLPSLHVTCLHRRVRNWSGAR